ncbi:hypothetical protein ACFW9N_17150 [Streptomyces sp. NPDC059496]|uniref:hypothetical protein n=1 Tax=Streptomyces sp. NPDC059496 TaxID=3346851 RepID=UPI00368D148F
MGFYSYDDQLERCARCGEYLTGRQERYCSPACRQAAHRARQPRELPPMKNCPLCGELFEVWHPRKRFCDYKDEAGYDCVNAQEDLLEVAEFALEDRRAARCAHCGESAGWTGKGRPRRFCSPRCKQADYRKRKTQTAA